MSWVLLGHYNHKTPITIEAGWYSANLVKHLVEGLNMPTASIKYKVNHEAYPKSRHLLEVRRVPLRHVRRGRGETIVQQLHRHVGLFRFAEPTRQKEITWEFPSRITRVVPVCSNRVPGKAGWPGSHAIKMFKKKTIYIRSRLDQLTLFNRPLKVTLSTFNGSTNHALVKPDILNQICIECWWPWSWE